jgi:hypothetical protein
MTLEQYAYLVAIVVITFVFLTIQLRLGTRALKAGTVQNLQNQTMAVYGMLLEDMDLFMKGMEDPTSLNKLDRAKFNALMTVNFHALQNAYFQIQSGAYDDCMQEGWWQVMRNNFLSPGYRRYWERRQFMLDPGFCDFVEKEVMKRDPTPEYAERVSA